MTEVIKGVALVLLVGVPVLLAYQAFLVYKNQLALIRDLDAARIQGRQSSTSARSRACR